MKTNDITVTPVKKYAPPKYPTLANAQSDPKLLRKLPSRWEKNAAVVAAVGMLGAMSLTSCGVLNLGSDNASLLNVAPVFIHGEGTGSMGCVMIVPPVFLSEQEAYAIIKGVTADVGLNFTAEPPEYIATNNISTRPLREWEKDVWQIRLGDGTVGLDLYDEEKRIAVIYIEMKEANECYIYPDSSGRSSSVTTYDPRELAKLTIEDFTKQKGDITIGVFYEPGKSWESEEHKIIYDEYSDRANKLRDKYFKEPYYDETKGFLKDEYSEEFSQKVKESREEYETKTKQLIEEDLRAQVRDFIEWLQGQGII